MEDVTGIFWTIFEGLENGNGNGGMKTVNHRLLHEALVSSGKFFTGDAVLIIEDMVKAGNLEVVSFETYKRK